MTRARSMGRRIAATFAGSLLACSAPHASDAGADARADEAVVAVDVAVDARIAVEDVPGDVVAVDAALPVAPPGRGLLYEPDAAHNADEQDSYPHAIRLHGTSTILATFERQLVYSTQPPRGWLVYRSVDDGAHFTQAGPPVAPAHFTDATFALQPNLIELTRPTGSLAAGALLLAGVTGSGTRQEAQLFRSVDHGATWQFHAVLDATDTAHDPRRIWEPFLLQLDDARLVAFYSNELVPGGRQEIVARTSHDGGATWSAPAAIWASSDDGDRPGMSTVARMNDGRYAMTVEMCGAPGDFCRVHIKFSRDGLAWGTGPRDLGTRVMPTTGHPLHGNPFVAWTPAGGARGTLIVSGRDLQASLAQPETPAPGHGQTLLVNTQGGDGPWHEFTAPIAWTAGATYTQAGYRNALLPSADGTALLYLTSSFTGTVPRNRMLYATAAGPALPYADPFARGTAVGWQSFGGTWSVHDGALVDAAHGAGDKALAGSTGWSDYVLSGEVRLDASGNAGLLVRASDPGVGADTIDGYFIGLSSTDDTVFIGREHHAWTLLGAAHAVAGGIAAGTFYRVTVRAVGCAFDITVTPPSGSATHFAQSDTGCTLTTGAIGVRTFGTAAAWRAITVTELSP